MTDPTRPSLRGALLFSAIGLALGGLIGLLALHSWLGIGFLILGLLLFVGIWAELDFLTDLAEAALRPVWRMIARAGAQWAGADPDRPVHGALRLAFGLGFLAGLGAAVLIRFAGPMGGA